ncbi:MAG: DHHW family protein, partial [Eubacteriales bacterium]|nr:DHHW family protein [Eubacteriales bacterium]
NKLEIYDALWSRRDEYLYFKSDHHWTARGAYYAYAEFAASVGFEPVDIGDLEERLLNDKMQGTMYDYTRDERVKKIYDSLYVYIPRKAHTMTVYRHGTSTKYDSSVLTQYGNYGCFIASDNPYTIINVPDNPQNVNILVLKDSFGNAMIPFLTEHYGNIVVVDPRHVTFDIYDLLKDYPLRDVLFLNNIYNPNVFSWSLNLLRVVGVK